MYILSFLSKMMRLALFEKSDIFRAYHINNLVKIGRTSRILRKMYKILFFRNFQKFQELKSYSIHISLKIYTYIYICIYICILHIYIYTYVYIHIYIYIFFFYIEDMYICILIYFYLFINFIFIKN